MLYVCKQRYKYTVFHKKSIPSALLLYLSQMLFNDSEN